MFPIAPPGGLASSTYAAEGRRGNASRIVLTYLRNKHIFTNTLSTNDITYYIIIIVKLL